MRVRLAFVAALTILVDATVAVFADDAWSVDYHLALLGTPLEHTTFFHQPFADSKASLLYTLSEKAVLGAVNPKDGSLVWRQRLSARTNTTSTFLRAGQGQDILVSAVDGEVTGWSASDGRQVWTLDLGQGSVKDLEILELPSASEEPQSKDAIVLVQDAHSSLIRVDGASGKKKWEFRDDSGDVPYQVSASTTEVFYITIHSTMLGAVQIRATSLDPVTGHKTDQYTLNSDSELSSTSNILTVGANTASPIIAWTDSASSVFKVNIIGTKSISTFKIPQTSGESIEKIALHAPYHINARPHFLVHYQTATQHWAEVYHVDLKAKTVSKAYSLPKLGGKGAFSTTSVDANVYFTRISESEASVVSSASHGILARWAVNLHQESPVHAVLEISVKGDTVSAMRAAVLLSSGDWIGLRDGVVNWQRPEALAGTLAAVWAYPQAESNAGRELEIEAHSNPVSAYIHRIRRHVRDLKALPGYLLSIPDRLLNSVGISTTASVAAAPHNNFGYHKLVICATESGRLIAVDAGSKGELLWNIPLPQDALSADGTVRHLTARLDGTILVAGSSGHTVAELNASTGELVPAADGHGKVVGLAASSIAYEHLPGGEIAGRPVESSQVGPAWQFIAGKDQYIASIVGRPAEDPVASIGKVLGDRRVLYKYLNPNLLLITAISAAQKTVSMSLVDALSGSLLFSASHDEIDTTLPIASAVSENWFAYSFGIESVGPTTKGFQLVVGELYESAIPDDRGPMSSTGNFTADYQPHVITQTYTISEPISHMAVTQTRQGITSRELLAVLPQSNSIVGIPRSVIDPRRPVGRVATSLEMSEGLMQYAPVLDFDPKWHLNHQRELVGIEQVTTSPAILESTSLVFAYGLDIFGTRVSPSFSFDVLGKDFNKLQMLATVVALFIGTLIVAPLVRRKQIDARWQFS